MGGIGAPTVSFGNEETKTEEILPLRIMTQAVEQWSQDSSDDDSSVDSASGGDDKDDSEEENEFQCGVRFSISF